MCNKDVFVLGTNRMSGCFLTLLTLDFEPLSRVYKKI